MNWDFVPILKFSKSGTNRRLWDRRVSDVTGGRSDFYSLLLLGASLLITYNREPSFIKVYKRLGYFSLHYRIDRSTRS